MIIFFFLFFAANSVYTFIFYVIIGLIKWSSSILQYLKQGSNYVYTTLVSAYKKYIQNKSILEQVGKYEKDAVRID